MSPSAPPLQSETWPLLQRERRRLVANLARSLGLAHLALAEDAVQAATEEAIRQWPLQGAPAQPVAWLWRVARHWAIDQLRREARQVELPADDGWVEPPLQSPATDSGARFAGALDDDELALLFAACHPALPAASQVALALRALAGMALQPLAAGLLCSEAALAQRLARARESLRGVALGLPAGADLPPRRESVLAALAVMFNAGYAATEGQASHPPRDWCWEAIRLARAVAAHRATAHPDADALAATLLLHGARLTGRTDATGDIVPLTGQPRDRWDAGMLQLGFAHLQRAQAATRLSRWHLQAGIAATHAAAPDYAGTDWARIVDYYELLLALDASAAPRLGHAIALAEAGDPARSHALLEQMLPRLPARLRPHGLAAPSHAAQRLGDLAGARRHLATAVDTLADSDHAADRRLLQRRLDSLR